MMIGGLPGVEASLCRTEHVQLIGENITIRVHYPDPKRMGGPLDPQSNHVDRIVLPL